MLFHLKIHYKSTVAKEFCGMTQKIELGGGYSINRLTDEKHGTYFFNPDQWRASLEPPTRAAAQ